MPTWGWCFRMRRSDAGHAARIHTESVHNEGLVRTTVDHSFDTVVNIEYALAGPKKDARLERNHA